MSRETRRLLAAALVAVVSLWVLARIRFPDRPVTPNPIPSLLSPFATLPRFANLASEISDLQDRLSESWLSVRTVPKEDETGSAPAQLRTAILRSDSRALVLVDSGHRLDSSVVLAADPATGLTVIRTERPTEAVLTPWTPSSPERPRYFMATSATQAGVSLRPVFVASMVEANSPAWSGSIWLVPGTDVSAGDVVVTTDGELVGLAIDDPRGQAIVPANVLLTDAQRLANPADLPTASMGVEVQPLTRTLETATGATSGLVVSWIAPRSLARDRLDVGDVIEAVDGHPVATMHDWNVVTARLTADSARLQVWRGDRRTDVTVRLRRTDATSQRSPALGLTLRSTASGTVVTGVEPGTAGATARLRSGDTITRAGRVDHPSPAQLGQLFDMLPPGGAILVAFTRDESHYVVGLAK